MNKSDIQNATLNAIKNKHLVEQSLDCGCFKCCKIFKKEEIKEWTDGNQTAICPFCNQDSVLTNLTINVNHENLKTLHSYWFTN